MTHQIVTEIHIETSTERVWNILMDFPAYPSWNPFITEIAGIATSGQQLKIKAGGMGFKPMVLSHIPKREFIWKGSLLFPHLFDGTHTFKLESMSINTCVFKHSESFSGILVPLFRSKLDKDTKEGFIKMNHAIKERAEAGIIGESRI